MSGTAPAKVSPLTDMQKSDKYQQALSLNLDCGSDTLRKLIEKKLSDKNTSLKKYVHDQAVQTKLSQLNLFKEQKQLLNGKNPDLLTMDISLLTLVLLELFSLDMTQEDAVKRLRKCRNTLAHSPRSQLEDDQVFNEASQHITGLSKDTTPEFEKEIKLQIKELKERKLVRTHSMLDIVRLLNESFMVKLMDKGDVDNVDVENEIWIKYCLTKFVRLLARSYEMDILLQTLKDAGVFTATTKRTIEHTHHAEKQFQQLIVFMVDETRENLLKFCSVMREMNSDIADFVIHNHDGSRDIGKVLKDCEKEKVETILKLSLVVEKTGTVACEDLHTLVNERRRCVTSFDLILECMKELFPFVSSDDRDTQFCGISWSEDVDDFDDLVIPDAKEEILTDMPCDKFAKYLATEMTKVISNIGPHIEAIVDDEHSIHSSLFAKFKPEEMEKYFKPGLEKAGMRYNIGVKEGLINVQRKINIQLNRTSQDKTDCLREFDKPGNSVTYVKCDVRPAVGNLLVATHEFIQPIVRKNTTVTLTYMVKQIVRFAVACLNGKQNGTIHFGIQEIENGGGQIVGLPFDTFSDVDSLNKLLTECLKGCLKKEHISSVQRCIRPVQIVYVEGKSIVLEVDVVPYSLYAKEALQIRFPQNGYQKAKCYIFVNNIITSVDDVEKIASTVKDLYLERKSIEANVVTIEDKEALDLKQIKRLEWLLLRGNRYVTDYFYPVICCGQISGTKQEDTVREQISQMSVAFTSAEGVLDFDSSVHLRESIEKGEDVFAVKVPDEFKGSRHRRESGTSKEKIWMYANGNVDIHHQTLEGTVWMGKRYKGVKNALGNIRRNIPDGRGLVIFFVFQKTLGTDIMLEIARECFIDTFTDGCIVIADNNEVVQDWKNELTKLIDKKEIEKCFVVSLSWNDVCCVMNRVFRQNKDTVFQFPNKKGYVVEMTEKERKKLEFKTIDIIDGSKSEKYRLEEEGMSDEDRREKMRNEEKCFYRGENVSFLNFYYDRQVGPRDDYEARRSEIERRLNSRNEDFYEIYTLEHHPGAGGTTLGRYLLWTFSQVKGRPELAYRCCIVNTISETTAEEIYQFLYFKEDKEAKPKPVIVLIDNGQEEHINNLKANINSLAYRYGGTDVLFCLLLLVTRVPLSHVSRYKVLTHDLRRNEKKWFKKKFIELEKRGEDVNTLIAFNVMRKSFDSQFVKQLTEGLIKEIKEAKEIRLLECLSLVTVFDRDHSVPECVFDSFMHGKAQGSISLAEYENKGPVGLVDLNRMRKHTTEFQETWNVKMSGSLKLLIKHQTVIEPCHYIGVSIVSQALAEAVLKYIVELKKINIEKIVDSLLDLVDQHGDAKNPMSGQFVKLVCSLFKTRQPQEGDTKLKFSDLVLHLEQPVNGENDADAHKRVINVMKKCFHVTKDPMVGQQLARFFIHIHRFDNAEDAIRRSLDLKHQSSYLLDTYGQVFKMQMLYLLDPREVGEMDNVEAARVVNLAFSAVEKFREAQEITGSLEEENNLGCFNMEVKTILMLLEYFHKFQCFENMENFRRFLTDETFDVQISSFKAVLDLVPKLENLRLGREAQEHAHNSLRKLEEGGYMIKNEVTLVETGSKYKMLMKIRERFLRFYGSEEEVLSEFWYGVGLRPLMQAYKDDRPKFQNRFRVAERQIQSDIKKDIEDNLLIYLGYKIIELSAPYSECTADEYRRLASYSSHICSLQMSISKLRPYTEGYLYYVMLHWPLSSRLNIDIEGLYTPETLISVVQKWEDVYKKNHDIKTFDQLLATRPKTYFALGNGSPGNDIADLEILRKQWRKEKKEEEGRKRKEVRADKPFQHPIFENKLCRLSGVVEKGGNKIRHMVEYRDRRKHIFHIDTYDNRSRLSNKTVTFVLGFSWMGPTALDVRRADKTSRQVSTEGQQSAQHIRNSFSEDSSLESPITTQPIITLSANKPGSTRQDDNTEGAVGGINASAENIFTAAGSTRQDDSTEGAVGGIDFSAENIFTATDETKLPADTAVVTMEEESRHVIDSLVSVSTDQSIVCVIGRTQHNIRIFVIHMSPKTYIYYIDKDLVDKWHLDELVTNKDVNIVFSDIRMASVALMTEYEILIDGHIWDIKLMLDKCSLDSSDTEHLKECGFTQETVARWTEKDDEYGLMLAPGYDDMLIILDLIARAKLIRRVYDTCKGNLDNDVRSSKLYSELRKDIFAAAHPSSMEEKVNQLKRRQKKKRQKLNKAKNQDENQKVEDSEQALGKQTKSKQKKGKKK
ncbi:uncharacterized protein LOC123539661 isoform X2 [Mercenaria mercenaria]|uniref:uncharacterized protein LOC123539661 isoform X2 n=1 Tax=Mercenaria mercenaria TaxID=6596 RepID=UPI00234EEF46|nr:uncharacterized protein LOC123539661 isoform X2 [Mercenaria mercenaria]